MITEETMKISDYDEIITLVEEEIIRTKKEISEIVCGRFSVEDRRLGEFFQTFDSEERTFLKYVVDRKNIRALEEFIMGETKEDVCFKYNIDPANFNKAVKQLFSDKTPKELRDEHFQCPGPQYLKDIIGGQISTMNKSEYKSELINMIDENTRLKMELSDFKKAQILEKRSNKHKNISLDEYKKFLKIENLRVVYGFNIQQILSLYQSSLETGKNLVDLCDDAIDSYYFDEEDYSKIIDIDTPFYHLTDDMDSGEAYAYYYGDDDYSEDSYDPYAPTELDMLEYKEYEDLCHEIEYYDDFDEPDNSSDDDFDYIPDEIEQRDNNDELEIIEFM